MPTGSPDPSRAFRPADLRAALLVALAAAALYAPTLAYDFTGWDDPGYVVNNPLIRSLDLASIRLIFSRFYFANYTPLHLLSYAIVRATAGPAPWAYHALNAGLHALCAGLGYLLLRRLALPVAGAALGAAIFLTHPAQVEVVAWVNQTKTLLATAFCFSATLALLRCRRERAAGKGGRGAYVGALILFAGALLSKPQAIAFPGILFAAERSLGRGPERLPGRAWIPFAILAGLGAWIGEAAQAKWGAVKLYGSLGLAGSLLESLILFIRYLRLTFLPTELTVVYELRRVESFLDPRVLASAILLAAIAAAAFRLRAARGRPWHALIGFAAPLVPILGWVPLHVPMAERYLYPSLLAFGWWVGGAAGALPARCRRALWIVPVLFASLALARMPAWKDAHAVWETAIRDHPGSAHAWIGRGAYRADTGQVTPAEGDFREALRLAPENVEAWTNLGVVLNRLGRSEEAVRAWERAGAIEPRAVWPRMFIARHLSRRGENARALALHDGVIRQKPDMAMAYLYRAAARQRTGDLAGVEADLARAAALDPFLTDAHTSLGRLREQRGDLAGARKAYLDYLTYFAGDPAEAWRVRERLQVLGEGR